jgi:hypothetical protein
MSSGRFFGRVGVERDFRFRVSSSMGLSRTGVMLVVLAGVEEVLLSSCCTLEAPTTRSDQVRSGAEEGGTVWVNGASRTLVLWQVLGLLVRAGVEESMVSELLSLVLCVYCVVGVFCAKNKQGTK